MADMEGESQEDQEALTNMDYVVVDRFKLGHLAGWVSLAQGFGVAAITLVAVWMGHYRGGFAWHDNPAKEFNYHPLFMVIGMIVLYGEAVLVYRVFPTCKKLIVKIIHALLHLSAMVFMAVGLKAVFDSHNLAKPALHNLYSLHSWLGIITVSLFSLQWLLGFVSFLYPGLPLSLRSTYKPVHVYWGLTVLGMATATALMGITEKAFFSVMKTYPDYIPEGYVLNFLGLMLVGFTVTIVYIVTNSRFSRPVQVDESHSRLLPE